MDAVAVTILLLFGLLFGIISATAGIGGGAFYMSVMVFYFIIPINEARDTSTFIIALFSKIDITWYIPALGFCSGVFGLYTGMEKIIDKEKIKNGK